MLVYQRVTINFTIFHPSEYPKAQSDLIRKGAIHAAQAAQIQADEARALLLHRHLDALRRGEGCAKKGVAVEADGQDAVVHAVPLKWRWMGGHGWL